MSDDPIDVLWQLHAQKSVQLIKNHIFKTLNERKISIEEFAKKNPPTSFVPLTWGMVWGAIKSNQDIQKVYDQILRHNETPEDIKIQEPEKPGV